MKGGGVMSVARPTRRVAPWALFASMALLSGLPAWAAAPARPSFDCRKATTQVEHTICGAPALARADTRLARLHKAVRAALPARAWDRYRDNQSRWLARRQTACPQADVRCLTLIYDERL